MSESGLPCTNPNFLTGSKIPRARYQMSILTVSPCLPHRTTSAGASAYSSLYAMLPVLGLGPASPISKIAVPAPNHSSWNYTTLHPNLSALTPTLKRIFQNIGRTIITGHTLKSRALFMVNRSLDNGKCGLFTIQDVEWPERGAIHKCEYYS